MAGKGVRNLFLRLQHSVRQTLSTMSDPFASFAPLCRCSESAEDQLRKCHFCKGSQESISSVSGEDSSDSDDVPTENTPIVMLSVSENSSDKEPEQYQTPEEQLPALSGEQRNAEIEFGQGDEATSELVPSVDLGKDTDPLFSSEKSQKLEFKECNPTMLDTVMVGSPGVRLNAAERNSLINHPIQISNEVSPIKPDERGLGGMGISSEGFAEVRRSNGDEMDKCIDVHVDDLTPKVVSGSVSEQGEQPNLVEGVGETAIESSAKLGEKTVGKAEGLGQSERRGGETNGLLPEGGREGSLRPIVNNQDALMMLGENTNQSKGDDDDDFGIHLVEGIGETAGIGSSAVIVKKIVGGEGSLGQSEMRAGGTSGLLPEGNTGITFECSHGPIVNHQNEDGDADFDIVEAAIKAGMKFPRPRWWRPGGYKYNCLHCI